MSHWSQDAQAGGGAGMSDRKAGDPVQPCVQQASLEPVVDFDEMTLVDPELHTPDASPPLETELQTPAAEPPIEHELTVLPPEKE